MPISNNSKIPSKRTADASSPACKVDPGQTLQVPGHNVLSAIGPRRAEEQHENRFVLLPVCLIGKSGAAGSRVRAKPGRASARRVLPGQ